MTNMLSFLFFYAPRSLRSPELEQKISFLDRHWLAHCLYSAVILKIDTMFMRNEGYPFSNRKV